MSIADQFGLHAKQELDHALIISQKQVRQILVDEQDHQIDLATALG